MGYYHIYNMGKKVLIVTLDLRFLGCFVKKKFRSENFLAHVVIYDDNLKFVGIQLVAKPMFPLPFWGFREGLDF